jgi:amidase
MANTPENTLRSRWSPSFGGATVAVPAPRLRTMSGLPTRMFLTILLVTGLALVAVPAQAGPAQAPSKGVEKMIAAAPVGWGHDRGGFDLDAATIPDIQRQFAAHRLSSVRLTQLYLERIHRLDPQLHAVITLNPLARVQALAADLRRLTGRSRGPLDGIPVLLKDNIDTALLRTTAGSRALLGIPPLHDAALVSRLKAAGAVLLGKANLSEWANFRSYTATGGWSGVGGQTNNPYVLDRNPSGSSSGPAVAVAAALSQVAVGTETNGSIVSPSGQNGVVGMKPSLGLVSRTGVVPITSEQDTAGPIARHVVDAAITLGVLQGKDRKDAATQQVPADQPNDYTSGLAGADLAGKRIGVWRQGGIDAGTNAVVQHAVEVIQAHGGTVVEVELDAGDSGDLSFKAMKSEFVRDLAGYLRTRPGQEKTLAQLVKFNERDPVELSKFDQSLFLECLTVPPASDPTIVAARAEAKSLARGAIDQLLTANKLDAIISPSNSPAWKTSYGNGDAFLIGSSGAAAVAGYPNLSVPAGYVGELPVGVNFIGGHWQDARLLQIGAAFENAADARHAPKFLPTIG